MNDNITQDMKNNIEIYKAGAAYGEVVGKKLAVEAMIATIKQWQGTVTISTVVELLESILEDAQKELDEFE